jgi:hypothetical protein
MAYVPLAYASAPTQEPLPETDIGPKREAKPAPPPEADTPPRPVTFEPVPQSASPASEPEKVLTVNPGRGVSDPPTALAGAPVVAPPPAPGVDLPISRLPAAAEQLVLSLQVNDITMVEFMTGLSINQRYYLGLKSLAEAMEFPIEVNAVQQSAKGWFIRERNSIKIRGRNVIVRGNIKTLKEDEILVADDDIYVDANLLQEWMDLEFNIELSQLMLEVTSRVSLPFEEKIRRERLASRLKIKPEESATNYKRHEDPYQLYSFPYVDMSLNSEFNKGSSQGFSNNYSLLAKGDIGYMTGEVFLAGDLTNDRLQIARLNMRRTDENRMLLGWLNASQVEFGDIDSNSLPLVASSASGRGLLLSNRSLYRPDQFDLITFRDSVPPGWDVELYRNGVLLDIQTVGNEGQYEFRDVPILFGRNAFKIIKYGPRGEIEEQNKEYYAGSTLLEAGDFTYNLSLSDSARSVLGVGDSNIDTKGLRAVGELEYGLTKWMTLAAGASQLTQNDEDYRYLTAAVRTSLGPVLSSLDFAYDPENAAKAYRLSLASGIYDIDLRAQHTIWDGLISDENQNVSRLLDSSSLLEASTFVNLFGSSPMTVALSGRYNRYENGDSDTTISNTLSQSFGGFSLSNRLERSLGSSKETSGNLALRGSIKKVLLGAEIDYGLQPQPEFRQMSLTSQFYWSEKIINRFTLTSSGAGTYRYTNSVLFDRGKYSLNVYAGSDQDHNHFIGVGLNSSFTKLPHGGGWHFQGRSMAETGGAAIRAYLDKNADGKRDDDEPTLDNVGFRKGNSPIAASQPDMAFTASLAPEYPTRISLDKEKLGDPMRQPSFEGYEIMPRPGHTALIDIPIIEVALVEGRVFEGSSGTRSPASKVRVDLLNNNNSLIATTTSEFDGYYLLDRIPPGAYKLRAMAPPNSSLAGSGVQREVEVKSSEFYTFDLDLAPDFKTSGVSQAVVGNENSTEKPDLMIIQW